jgi:hypothetical protein
MTAGTFGETQPELSRLFHHPAKAKRVIFLYQAGGPSHLETFDYKPLLNQRNGEDLPESVRLGQRLTGMSGNQSILPLAGSIYNFQQYGQSGAWLSELLPKTAKIVDELCIVRSMFTEAINHDPAITFMQTGSQISGRPSMGAWLSYGLGSENQNLPGFVVLITPGKVDQPLYSRLWGSGFLPSQYQGVQFRSGKEPVLYLANPPGISTKSRELMLGRLREQALSDLARAWREAPGEFLAVDRSFFQAAEFCLQVVEELAILPLQKVRAVDAMRFEHRIRQERALAGHGHVTNPAERFDASHPR